MKECTKCGKEILTGAIRCCYCGALQETPEKAVQEIPKKALQETPEEAIQETPKEAVQEMPKEVLQNVEEILTDKEDASEKVVSEERVKADARKTILKEETEREKQPHSNFCSNCGKELKPGYRYCPACGSTVKNQSGITAQAIMDIGKETQRTAKNIAKSLNDSAVQPLKSNLQGFAKKKEQEWEEKKKREAEARQIREEEKSKEKSAGTEAERQENPSMDGQGNPSVDGQGNEPTTGQETSGKVEDEAKSEKEEKAVNPKLREKLMQLSGSGIFLAFCILYSANLLYQLFSQLSITKWVGKIFSILLCVSIWKIYIICRKKEMDDGTFSMACGVMTAKYVVEIIMSIFLCLISIITGPFGLIAAIVTAVIDICYMGSLRKAVMYVRKIAEGKTDTVRLSFYPILVLGINIIRRSWTFLKALFLQGAASGMTGLLHQSGSAASSGLASLFGSLGLDYGYSYGTSSSLIQFLIAPVEDWIQGLLGFSESPLAMFLAAAIPICEFMLLRRLRSWGK